MSTYAPSGATGLSDVQESALLALLEDEDAPTVYADAWAFDYRRAQRLAAGKGARLLRSTADVLARYGYVRIERDGDLWRARLTREGRSLARALR